jgi:biotin operon repressor
MSSPLVFVRDGRTLPYIPVTLAALKALRDTCELPREGGERRSYPHALATYMALLELANRDRSDRVALTQTELGSYAGMSRRAVQRALEDLQAAGLAVMSERHHGQARIENEYTVVEPPADESAGSRLSGAGVAPVRRSFAGARPSPPSEAQASTDCEEEQTEEARGRADVVPSDPVGELFAYWQQTCGHPQARPTRERTSKIKARLKDGYTPEQIRTAIDGAARAAFVADNGKRFDDLELICRTGAKLEDFIERAALPAPGDATNVHELRPRSVSELKYLEKREREQRGIDALERVMAAHREARNPSDIEGEATEL